MKLLAVMFDVPWRGLVVEGPLRSPVLSVH